MDSPNASVICEREEKALNNPRNYVCSSINEVVLNILSNSAIATRTYILKLTERSNLVVANSGVKVIKN